MNQTEKLSEMSITRTLHGMRNITLKSDKAFPSKWNIGNYSKTNLSLQFDDVTSYNKTLFIIKLNCVRMLIWESQMVKTEEVCLLCVFQFWHYWLTKLDMFTSPAYL